MSIKPAYHGVTAQLQHFGLAGMLNRCGLVTENNIRQIPKAYELYRLPKTLTAEQEEDLRSLRHDHCIPCEINL